MIRVLRHYLPMRRALLMLSETLLLFLAMGLGMTAHLMLKEPTEAVILNLAKDGLNREDGAWRCLLSAFLLALIAQVAIAFNELYDFSISMSRFDRASRFVSSTGSAILLSLGLVSLAHVWNLGRVLDFPGLSYSQKAQTLVFTQLLGFGLLYLWRNAFHFALRRWNFNERVLILGAGQAGRSLAAEMLTHSDSGHEVVAMIPEAGGYGVEPRPRTDRETPREVGKGPAEGGNGGLAHAAQFGSMREIQQTGALLLEPVTIQQSTAA